MDIVHCCSERKVLFRLPRVPKHKTFHLKFVGPVNTQKAIACVTYTKLYTLNLDTQMPITAGLNTITVSAVLGVRRPITEVKLVSIVNESYYVNATNIVASGGDSTTFQIELDAGAYRI